MSLYGAEDYGVRYGNGPPRCERSDGKFFDNFFLSAILENG
jgi:hypothetical protein